MASIADICLDVVQGFSVVGYLNRFYQSFVFREAEDWYKYSTLVFGGFQCRGYIIFIGMFSGF